MATGRPCSTCASPNRVQAEAAIQGGASIRSTALRFGLGPEALRRHLAHVDAGPSRRSVQGTDQGTSEGIEALVTRLEREAKGQTGRAFLDTARELRLALRELAQ